MVRSGPGPKSSPFIDQVIDKGSSPLITVQRSWRKSPAFTAYSPKEKGRICGGSEIIVHILPVPTYLTILS